MFLWIEIENLYMAIFSFVINENLNDLDDFKNLQNIWSLKKHRKKNELTRLEKARNLQNWLWFHFFVPY